MKTKLFFVAAISVLTVSCTKDYSCSCTYTSTSISGTETSTDTYQVNEATKDQAAAACNEATIVDTYDWQGETVTTTQNCSLTK